MPCGAHGTANNSIMPCDASFFSIAGFDACQSFIDSGKLVARNGTTSTPKIGIFVLVQRDQHFADLRLAGLHRALDIRRLEQRSRRMNRDLQFVAGCGGDVLGEQREIFAVRIVGRIGRRQIPFGLRDSRLRDNRRSEYSQQQGTEQVFIGRLLVRYRYNFDNSLT